MELKKIGEHKLKPEAIKTHPVILCGECYGETKAITEYRDTSSAVDCEELSVIHVHFEEVHVSQCCRDLLVLVNNDEDELTSDDAYEYKHL
ncbi:hypothetical protein HC752_21265 [Vibrio sp. S9_S30]|uniref:hypothetical protein n=1 Tax=Vibrio sp. S9_S30 TaxID=2720226 RepID=UPI001680E444|nr:hypothetical protein [Vibrio sp. S9_S30]MBD1559476.1 hypothetical protein [Vibrio sp. S9_S30]